MSGTGGAVDMIAFSKDRKSAYILVSHAELYHQLHLLELTGKCLLNKNEGEIIKDFYAKS